MTTTNEDNLGPDINDPFAQDYSSAAYNTFLDEADKDDRLGDQDFLITEKVVGHWDDGSPNVKLNGVLSSANNAKFNMMFSAPPAPDKLATVDSGRKRGIALSIRLLKELRDNYGVTPFSIEEGTTIRVKVDKDKVDKATGKYYLRGVSIKPKTEIGKANGAAPASNVGF
mgnify:CR=1 FL=1